MLNLTFSFKPFCGHQLQFWRNLASKFRFILICFPIERLNIFHSQCLINYKSIPYLNVKHSIDLNKLKLYLFLSAEVLIEIWNIALKVTKKSFNDTNVLNRVEVSQNRCNGTHCNRSYKNEAKKCSGSFLAK